MTNLKIKQPWKIKEINNKQIDFISKDETFKQDDLKKLQISTDIVDKFNK